MSECVESLTDFKDVCHPLLCSKERWVFRGVKSSQWDLTTSLDRSLDQISCPVAGPTDTEKFLLREFKRHFHRYSHYIPSENDTLEWMAMMQHYGAPTRLLDWTFSEYVALFFAIDEAKEGTKCAVWALNQKRCWDMFMDALPSTCRQNLLNNDKDVLTISWVLEEFRAPLICPLNPFHLSDRLAMQEATFLVPLDIEQSFMDNFEQSVGRERDSWKKIIIKCSREFLIDALTYLHRINVSHLHLFPGTDGLARSLRTTLLLSHLRPQV